MIKIKHGRRKNKPMRKEYYRGPIKISFHEAEKKISSTDRHNYHWLVIFHILLIKIFTCMNYFNILFN